MQKTKLKRTISTALCGLLTVGCLSACEFLPQMDNNGEVCPYELPDYTQSAKSYDLFGYVAPSSGRYTLDNIYYDVGEDFRTVERFEEYLDVGFNVTLLRYEDAFPRDAVKEDWETSDAKIAWDAAYGAGCRKIILTDRFFDSLIWDKTLVGSGEDYEYATVEELEAAVADRVSIYKDEEGFYGLALVDEPKWSDLNSYGLVYKAVRKALPNAFLHANLNPATSATADICDVETWKAEHEGKNPTREEGYRWYIHNFLEKTGANRVSVDKYQFLVEDLGSMPFRENFFSNLQILQDECKEHNAKLSFVPQTITHTSGSASYYRVVGKSEMWYEVNTLLGFGVDTIGFYTYFTYPYETTGGYRYIEEGSFLTREGERTNIYYYGQSILNDVKKFENVILNYDYQGAKFYLNDVLKNGSTNMFTTGTIPFHNTYEHTLLKGIEQDGDALLTTELKDETNDLYMYMIQNATDPIYSKYGDTTNTFTADFSGYEWVAEFDCGELTYVKLDNGKYTKTLSAGYAVYLVPLK